MCAQARRTAGLNLYLDRGKEASARSSASGWTKKA
jgi:hypothetical protein